MPFAARGSGFRGNAAPRDGLGWMGRDRMPIAAQTGIMRENDAVRRFFSARVDGMAVPFARECPSLPRQGHSDAGAARGAGRAGIGCFWMPIAAQACGIT